MKTILFDSHVALGAKMVDFAGWQMPVHYPKGIIHEHLAVRQNAGIFDVSHMGRIDIEGHDAERFLDYLATNQIEGKHDLSATYTVFCNNAGGCVDDLIVYRRSPERFFVIVNAGNRAKDLEHIRNAATGFKVAVKPRYEDGILAVQGPEALQAVKTIIPEASDLRPMRFVAAAYNGVEAILSGTGYTGAGGCEVYAPSGVIVALWERLIREGVEPIGLGARDTLRLEKGFALYGHELSEEIAPNETIASWTVKWDKGPFIGKEALERLEKSPGKRHEYGIVLKDKGIAREGYAVFNNGIDIGRVTSGTMSPSLGKAIAIILVAAKLEVGDNVEVLIRNKKCLAEVVKLPFA